jgi:hypothetical protein
MFYQTLGRICKLAEKYQTREFTASEFTKVIRRQFPAADFLFRTHRDYAVDPNMIVVSGIYDSHNDDNELPYIEISLCYHPEQQVYHGDQLKWNQISFDIAECICHELVHRDQYRKKIKFKNYKSKHTDIKTRADQEYLGDGAEIDAYGFSIVAESIVFGKPVDECSMYKIYQTTFDNDQSVLLKLEKHINKYLKQLEPTHEQNNSG